MCINSALSLRIVQWTDSVEYSQTVTIYSAWIVHNAIHEVTKHTATTPEHNAIHKVTKHTATVHSAIHKVTKHTATTTEHSAIHKVTKHTAYNSSDNDDYTAPAATSQPISQPPWEKPLLSARRAGKTSHGSWKSYFPALSSHLLRAEP